MWCSINTKRVLIGCEFSGVVRSAFRARGFDAWSCDLLPAEDGSQYHLQQDVIDLLGDNWDMAVFHPPCTHLAVSGARYFKRKAAEQQAALAFVRALLDAPIPHIALENPVSVISSKIRKPDQIIQPWMFGHSESKKTCLWLKDLPKLRPTHIAPPVSYTNNGRPLFYNQTPSGQNKLGPSADRWKKRSRTYQGIADAMAQQWGDYIR